MPSNSLLTWQTARMPRLQDVEEDCLHLETLHAQVPDRVQEYIRSYLVLLSAEFQRFCRDLHNECAEKLVESIKPAALQGVLRYQCVYLRKLDISNPNVGNLGADFNRYQFDFWPEVLAIDPRHAERKNQLDILNAWRNAIAHHNFDPAKLGGTSILTILHVRDWRTVCHALAAAFDTVVHNHLQATTGLSPWSP